MSNKNMANLMQTGIKKLIATCVFSMEKSNFDIYIKYWKSNYNCCKNIYNKQLPLRFGRFPLEKSAKYIHKQITIYEYSSSFVNITYES